MSSRKLAKFLAIKHAIGRLYRFFREWVAIPWNYAADRWSYMRFSGSFWPSRSREALQGLIMRLYHGLEVGLTYADPRPGFGYKVANDLLGYLHTYVGKYGADRCAHIAANVLRQYFERQSTLGASLEKLQKRFSDLQGELGDTQFAGGVKELRREEIQSASAIDFSRFVCSRHSFRRYENKPVPLDTLQKAVAMAVQSPSACNRQPVRVHVLEDPAIRDRVLTVQNGNRGWRDQPDRILLVSCDSRFYKESRERNAAYIDGGLFAMSLLYALHSLGVGTCCLNLNLTAAAARRIRKAVGLPGSSVLILLIAAGHLPETITVAASVRRNLDEVLHVI
ncbi:MAG TPA: nitroreductase family protein [bacterium]|nr:nitroreductase family protein [bacterium]HOX87410.1 nitroreductase family protein [bacterium]HPG46871.1 nitroreductase family protein [bacterium]HPM99149.1 nitroreductase family protein [bacterium]